jgi:hypothetical protein
MVWNLFYSCRLSGFGDSVSINSFDADTGSFFVRGNEE